MKIHAWAAAAFVIVGCTALEAQAQPTRPSPDKEETGAGSGSDGMAPQQGTGTGAVQSTPGDGRLKGPAPNPDSRLNREYGRDTQPEGHSLERSNPQGGASP